MSTYSLNCTCCRHIHESSEGFVPLCPRCQQLAALEAEIGRAVIGYDIVHYALGPGQYEPNLSQSYLQLCTERARLIAQWRKLHAEGAEGGER